jgi:iron complex transport system ATP-binding protein
MGDAAHAFDLSAVSLRRGGRPVLCDIDWTIREGERWVILGPNGSGKTSLMQVISTYLRPSEGMLSVLGRPLAGTDVHELRREMGYLSPALPSMIPARLTVGQIVDSAQRGAVIPWYLDPAGIDPGRTGDALAAVGVAAYANRRYGELSSGEQLRVQLARALVNHPRALLLDEPTANLDIGGRETLIASLERIAATDIGAMVLVIHRLEDIPPGFTHALLLRAGQVLASGPIDGVLADDVVSACFDTPLTVSRSGSRFGATVASDGQADGDSSNQSIASR